MNKVSFPSESEIASISKFVLRKSDKDEVALRKGGLAWTRTAWENKMDYEVNWLGVPIIQNPYDMILMQELIFELKPDVIVETGVAHGGSLIYYSSLLQLLGKGRVIGIDIDIRPHNRALIEHHPMIDRVTLLEGSSVDPVIVQQVRDSIKKTDVVLVILDSDHRKPHVLAELQTYASIATKGSYIVVFDTFMRDLVGLQGETPHFKSDSAMDAVDAFLTENTSFEIDASKNKYYVSSCTNGFLKKIAA